MFLTLIGNVGPTRHVKFGKADVENRDFGMCEETLARLMAPKESYRPNLPMRAWSG